jgi:hypothetical protein
VDTSSAVPGGGRRAGELRDALRDAEAGAADDDSVVQRDVACDARRYEIALGPLDDSEAAAGDVRMRAHCRPLAEELVGYGNSTTNTRLLPNGSPLDPTHSVLPFSTDDLATS